MQSITTRFLNPTNTLGKRVKATASTGSSLISSWNYELDILENHKAAASALKIKLAWPYEMYGATNKDNNGYVFIIPDEYIAI